MSFWEYANPVKFLKLSGALLPYFSILAAITIIAGISWGFFFTPDDYKQGATVKILYVHVPSAFVAINAWFMMLVASIIWLVRRHHVSALAAKAAAPIGIAMTIIGLVTGALWGQPMWGTWWEWTDARLVSMLFQFFLLLSVVALRSAIEDPDKSAKACALLSIVGCINVVIIKYSVEWWNVLHQPSSPLSTSNESANGPEFWMATGVMILAVYLFLVVSLTLATRNEILQRERRSQWVQEIVRTS